MGERIVVFGFLLSACMASSKNSLAAESPSLKAQIDLFHGSPGYTKAWVPHTPVGTYADQSGSGQDWARKMFDHTTHDFGVLARGAKAEHSFTVENIYEEDAHICAVRYRCGCITPRIGRCSLKTWVKTDIVAVVNTRAFVGRKDVILTVIFDKPFAAEVHLHVHCQVVAMSLCIRR